MAPITATGEPFTRRQCQGFTLVELALVLFIVALLASLVAPVVTRSIDQARESTLKEDLQVLRKAIDSYYANTGHYPDSLSQLVGKRYIRKVPIDPLTERADSWIEVPVDGAGGGISDVHSGAEGKAADGSSYRDW
jgi:prepilin-type N-terminal cleavage/methylation domain-containing protein